MTLLKLPFPPESTDYSLSNGTDFVETEVEGGKARRRKDYSSKPYELQVNWVFNQEDYQYFKAFYNSVTKKGSEPFLLDLIVDQPYIEERTVWFKGDSLQMNNPMGLSLLVSATLEVLPKDNPNFDAMILLFAGNTTRLNILEQLANYDLKV